MNIKTITIPAVVLSGSCVLLGLSPQSAQAFTFGNLDYENGSNPLNGVVVRNNTNGNFRRAYNFTFDGTPDYKLENVQLRLNRFGDTANEGNVLLIKGGTNTDVTPPTPDATNSVSLSNVNDAVTTTVNTVTFAPSKDFFFETGETYWLFVAANSGGDFGWRTGDTISGADPVSDPTGIAEFNSFVADLGTGWSTTTGTSFSGTGGRGLFQLNATKVPEPSNLIGLFTVVGLGMMSFKRQK